MLALETGMRREKLFGTGLENVFKYGIEVRRSISPTSEDTSLKTKNSKRDVSINKESYEIYRPSQLKRMATISILTALINPLD